MPLTITRPVFKSSWSFLHCRDLINFPHPLPFIIVTFQKKLSLIVVFSATATTNKNAAWVLRLLSEASHQLKKLKSQPALLKHSDNQKQILLEKMQRVLRHLQKAVTDKQALNRNLAPFLYSSKQPKTLGLFQGFQLNFLKMKYLLNLDHHFTQTWHHGCRDRYRDHYRRWRWCYTNPNVYVTVM